jgi:hypothetical protein
MSVSIVMRAGHTQPVPTNLVPMNVLVQTDTDMTRSEVALVSRIDYKTYLILMIFLLEKRVLQLFKNP